MASYVNLSTNAKQNIYNFNDKNFDFNFPCWKTFSLYLHSILWYNYFEKYAFFARYSNLTKGVGIMRNLNNHFSNKKIFMSVSGLIFKLGIFIISFYTCCVYIFIDCYLDQSLTVLYHTYLEAIEYITLSCIFLVLGSIMLDRLFRRL